MNTKNTKYEIQNETSSSVACLLIQSHTSAPKTSSSFRHHFLSEIVKLHLIDSHRSTTFAS